MIINQSTNKKYLALKLIILCVLIFMGCEEENEDTLLPPVTITYPQDNLRVSQIVLVTCSLNDDGNTQDISFCELMVDNQGVGIIDTTEPYTFEWNTTTYPYNSSHELIIRVNYKNDIISDSDPVIVIVDNSNSFPTQIKLYPIIYYDGIFNLLWTRSPDEDFLLYEIRESTNENMYNDTIVFTTDDKNDTTFSVSGIMYDNEKRYYTVTVTDIFGFSTSSAIMVGSSLPKIVYSSQYTGINLMDIDGDNNILLNSSIRGSFPQFSPDGRSIVFQATIENMCSDIFLMDIGGWDCVRITYNDGFYSYQLPKFSPDGTTILFESSPLNIIYQINVDGTDLRSLTDRYTTGQDRNPQFSPDGSKIVWESSVNPNSWDIFIMNSDGTNKTNLTNDPYHSTSPSFSPNGSKIIYSSQGEVYLMNSNGSNKIQLTNTAGSNYRPQFSPDGTKIVFSSTMDGVDTEIYIMDIDGGNQTRLTNTNANDRYAHFSSNGSLITFRSLRDGNKEIYIMDINGENQRNLTNSPGDDSSPRFQPIF